MKTYKNLYPFIISIENLLLAARKAAKGKRYKTNTARFHVELEKEIIRLHDELKNKQYQPGPYREFYICEPKMRMISAAPYRDRVVHHALCNIIQPLFERSFIDDSYANRIGKGTHRAVLRYQEYAGRYKYVLKGDVKKYFASIDHEILKMKIRKKIADGDTLWLTDRIIDCSNLQEPVFEYFPGDTLFSPFEKKRGLPLGNLTSQFFANIYLDSMDHYIKETLCCGAYVRYVDDWVIFGDDKSVLNRIRGQIKKYLEGLRLSMHENKSRVHRVSEGLCFLGHRIFPEYRRLKRENVVRFRKRMRKMQRLYEEGRMSWQDVNNSIQSWNAHAAFSRTWHLRSRLFSQYTFQRRSA